MKRKKGAQPGNLNALTHGFYSKVLTEADKLELQEADSVEGLDAEISILRLKFSQLLVRDPDNLDLMLRASAILARLVRVKHQLSPHQRKGLKQAIGNIVRDIGIPLGIKVGEKFIG